MDPTTCWSEPNPDDENDETLRANQLVDETKGIEERQASWHELALWNATLYTNRVLPGFRWGEANADQELWPTDLRTENIIERIGESMVSKASTSPLKPSLTPHGKSWKVERAVRLLDQFLFGIWRMTEAEDACIQMFRDAYISDLGCVKIGMEGSKLHVESVFFDNVIIDNRECSDRQPPRTYRIRRVMPRTVVEATWGHDLDHEAMKKPYVAHRQVGTDWVVVIEAWRLPDADGKGGRHTVACCGCLLEDEPWKEEWVPLEFFHWQDRTSGFFCKSGVEQLIPFQVRQNDLNDVIELSQDICCRPRLLLNANSMINVDEWDNEAGRFLMWSGSKPEPFEWKTNLQELYQERERNKAAAFSFMGVSEMGATADLPQQVRLDSSAGVREARNMEDANHLRLWSRFEKARLGVARKILLVLRRNSGADAFTAVYHPGGSKASAKNIPWEAVKTVTDDQYSWSMEATPIAALTPAARRELIRDYTSRGLIDPEGAEARRMEGDPNLERTEDLELAAEDDIIRHISILEDGDFEDPSELTNTTLGIRKVTANYHRLKDYEDVKTKVLENHIKWIVSAVSIQQSATQQPPEMPQPMAAFAPTQGMAGTSSAQAPAPHTQINNYPQR